MPDAIIRTLGSVAELRDRAPAWDSLWQRSDVALPTARAELVALWCECFAPRQRFFAIAVEQDGRLVAALPLVERKFPGLSIAMLPGNHWSPAGDLLIDSACHTELVCDALWTCLVRDHRQLLWLDAVPTGAPRWQALLQAWSRRSGKYVDHARFSVSQVQIGCDWSEYFASRSANHRRHIRKSLKRATQRGSLELVRYHDLSPDQVEPRLKECFEIEARGWKGHADTAVLSVPSAWEFYLRQARQLAAWGQLHLVVLYHQSRVIAFEYGWLGKGVYFSPKVAYDEKYRRYSPGQLLRHCLLERFFDEQAVHCVDFTGPTSPATAKWATHDYSMHRVLVPSGGISSQAVVNGYRWARPVVQRLRACVARLETNPRVAQELLEPSESEDEAMPVAPPALTP